jgi:DNA-binding IclR family transcriptional regulator
MAVKEDLEGDGARPTSAVQPVESVRRALRILVCFTPERPEIGVSDIARALDIHKSTVHRLLATLETEGFVRQLEDGRYALSWKLFDVASRFPASERAHRLVFEALSGLARVTGETAHLAVLDDADVLYVDKVEGSWALRMPSAVGLRLPAHCTALGKVLLAGIPDEQVRQLLTSRELVRLTDRTLTAPALVLEAVERARADGYAIDREEIEYGLLCIAAPVHDHRGATCAAISIAGPVTRLSAELDATIAAVRTAARSLSDGLGPDAAGLATRPR